jgi:crotonobetainyl-CoA:carnitine CoA-transferase CaiB-like acyl-CoA transferase
VTAGTLDGVRVVDFGHVWAGPYGTALLADLGAEVIKVESQTHLDVHRRQGPYAHGRAGVNRSGVWNAQNRGKLGCTLNLTTPEGVALAKRLVAVSDVAVENFAPRVMARLGLDYAALAAVRPGLIMVSLPGFGSTGPDRDHISYGQSLIAASGIAATTGYPGGPPMSLGESYPDLAAGCHAAFAVLVALHHRLETGEGQHVDLSQLESAICLLPEPILALAMTGRISSQAGNRDDAMAPHGCFRCRGEDRWVAIAVGTDEEWGAFRHVMGDPQWARDARFADAPGRRRYQDELERRIGAWTGTQAAEEVAIQLQQAGVPAAVSMTVSDLLRDPHLDARGAFVEVDHPETGPQVLYAPVWRFSDNPARIRRPAPCLGQHNDYVFGELLGLSADEIEGLVRLGIIH